LALYKPRDVTRDIDEITTENNRMKLYHGSRSLAYRKNPRLFQDFSTTPNWFFKDSVTRITAVFKYTNIYLLDIHNTLGLQCDSTIHPKTFITGCKETVWSARSRNTSYIYLHFYT